MDRAGVRGRRKAEHGLRAEVRAKLESHRRLLLERLAGLARRHGKVLYDGRWLDPGQVARDHRRLKWRSRRMLLEVLGVVLLVLGATYCVWFVLLVVTGG